jgi:hypothetical protein
MRVPEASPTWSPDHAGVNLSGCDEGLAGGSATAAGSVSAVAGAIDSGRGGAV